MLIWSGKTAKLDIFEKKLKMSRSLIGMILGLLMLLLSLQFQVIHIPVAQCCVPFSHFAQYRDAVMFHNILRGRKNLPAF